LAQSLDPAIREALLTRVRFYRDLGLAEFYRRPVAPELLAQLAAAPEAAARDQNSGATQTSGAPSSPLLSAEKRAEQEPASVPQPSLIQEDQPISPRQLIPAPPQVAAAVPVAERASALELIREEIGDCTRCPLHTGRNKLVFGDGSPLARLMFVGEGPGADEDAQGIPFVGRAGQLLNNMITAMGLKREEVYIANVVKCRPPGNRVPEPDEMATCSPFLFHQIDVIRPQVLVALGATAATCLLGRRQPLAGLRGRVHAFRGTQLIVTYHPAYLLRDPRQKKEAWADLQIAMRELGLKPPATRKGQAS
jgi:uracil-DNA glycosylase family 4